VIATIRAHPQIAHATGTAGAGSVLAVLLFAVAIGAIGGIVTLVARTDDWRLPRRLSGPIATVVVAVLAFVAVAIAPGLVSRGWHQFKAPVIATTADPAQRLTSLSGNRYNLWKVALQAFDRRPVTGSGAGTYEFIWNQHQLSSESVRNAHSLWLETMAELGVLGLLGIVAVAVTLGVLGVSVRRGTRRRPSVAASTALLAAFAVFLLHATLDWMWQVTAVTALALAGVAILSGWRAHRGLTLRWRWRSALAVAAIAAGIVQLPGLISTIEIRRSQAAVRRNDGATALAWARAAVSAEPWAASPYVQRGLVLEAAGKLRAAAADLRTATRNEPTNFRQWALLARVQAERGHLAAALRDYNRARQLSLRGTVLGAPPG
jgi:O-antigen ligase